MMHTSFAFGSLFVMLATIVLPILLVVFLGLAVVRMITGNRDERGLTEDENQQMQEIWRGLQRMEQRIENLETILIEKRESRAREPRI